MDKQIVVYPYCGTLLSNRNNHNGDKSWIYNAKLSRQNKNKKNYNCMIPFIKNSRKFKLSTNSKLLFDQDQAFSEGINCKQKLLKWGQYLDYGSIYTTLYNFHNSSTVYLK